MRRDLGGPRNKYSPQSPSLHPSQRGPCTGPPPPPPRHEGLVRHLHVSRQRQSRQWARTARFWGKPISDQDSWSQCARHKHGIMRGGSVSLLGGLSASHNRWERQLLRNSDSPMETSGYEHDHIRNAAHEAIASQFEVLELLPQWG